MRLLAGSYAAVAAVGAYHAVGQGRSARFFGVRLPGTPIQHSLTIGSPLSAPPIMLVALLATAWRTPGDPQATAWVRRLGALFLVGIAGEPDTWSTLRRPASDPISTACIALDVLLPAALIRSTR